MWIIDKYKSIINVSTFFYYEIFLLLILTLSTGFFGIRYLHNCYQKTIEITTKNNQDQLKLLLINQNLFKFFIYDEKSFSDVINGNNIDSSLIELNNLKMAFYPYQIQTSLIKI